MAEQHKVLVVEDNDFVRMQIVTFLKGAGFSVFEASGADAALDHIAAHDDLALGVVDIRMEPVGGWEFIKGLRGRDIDMPVILVTGDQNTDLLEQANMWGVGAVLMKPVEKERLIKTATRIIASSERKK
jgi:DNA-binding NtrC family response regulator